MFDFEVMSNLLAQCRQARQPRRTAGAGASSRHWRGCERRSSSPATGDRAVRQRPRGVHEFVVRHAGARRSTPSGERAARDGGTAESAAGGRTRGRRRLRRRRARRDRRRVRRAGRSRRRSRVVPRLPGLPRRERCTRERPGPHRGALLGRAAQDRGAGRRPAGGGAAGAGALRLRRAQRAAREFGGRASKTTFVLQSSASNLLQLRARVLRGLRTAGPALFSIYRRRARRTCCPATWCRRRRCSRARSRPSPTTRQRVPISRRGSRSRTIRSPRSTGPSRRSAMRTRTCRR